jgi:adenine-specific DNA methylase
VRAAIIGLLMPATEDPKKDREIFLRVLTMDNEGLLKRKTKNIPLRVIYERLTPREREGWFKEDSDPMRPKFKKGIGREQRAELQRIVFLRMSYDDRLAYCDRPEQIDGPSEESWNEINAHLGTSATNIVELIQDLGKQRFGHVPRVGDAFCGGGSIPFEASRIGCEAYGSDLNPVAALLTWAALNIIGGGEDVAKRVRDAQQEVYAAVDRQIIEWGIEHNEKGDRADAYLYCCETRCPECSWMVPIAPSWVIGEKSMCIAVLKEDERNKRFDIGIRSGACEIELENARNAGTVGDNELVCPHCKQPTPIARLRGDRRGSDGTVYGLRLLHPLRS